MNTLSFFASIGIFSLVWILSGIIGAWRFQQGSNKETHITHGEEKMRKKIADEVLLSLIIFFTLSALGGFFTLYYFEKEGKYNCWYYNKK